MTFARFLGSSEEVLRWERRATTMQRDLGVSSVCQYDLRHLEAGDVTRLAAEHVALSPDRDDPPTAAFLAVGELTFTDVGTVTGLRSVAAALPDDGHLVLRRPPDLLRRILEITGLRHQRMMVEP